MKCSVIPNEDNFMLLQPDWPAPLNIRACTTLRQSNIQRDTCYTQLHLPDEPIWLDQKHTNIAVKAVPEHAACVADAIYTDEPGIVCAILTADCLPILLCHEQGDYVAAIHAGWRGLASGVIEATLAAMNIPHHRFLAWLGPAIGPQRFEVKKEVYDAFVKISPEAVSAFRPFTAESWLANLYELAKQRLHSQGIERIYGGDFCTYSEEDKFFSYRRDKGNAGRMI